MLLLTALIFCIAGSAVLLLLSFFLLPWAKQRVGRCALALIPLSTFVGAYLGWAVLMMMD